MHGPPLYKKQRGPSSFPIFWKEDLLPTASAAVVEARPFLKEPGFWFERRRGVPELEPNFQFENETWPFTNKRQSLVRATARGACLLLCGRHSECACWFADGTRSVPATLKNRFGLQRSSGASGVGSIGNSLR